MSQPISNDSPNDREPEGGERTADGVDPTVEQFRAQNNERKRNIFRRMAQGAAFETGKEIANDQDLGERVMDFITWLGEHLS